jgi:hypothetical protein
MHCVQIESWKCKGRELEAAKVQLKDLEAKVAQLQLVVSTSCTANEGPVRIQYKCLVPIYVFPEMKLLFPKQNYNVLSPSSYTHISVTDLYISRIGLPFCCRKICGPILGIYKSLTDT